MFVVSQDGLRVVKLNDLCIKTTVLSEDEQSYRLFHMSDKDVSIHCLASYKSKDLAEDQIQRLCNAIGRGHSVYKLEVDKE